MFNQLIIFATSHAIDISFKGSDHLSSNFVALHLRKKYFARAIDCSGAMVSMSACTLASCCPRPIEGADVSSFVFNVFLVFVQASII